MTEETTIPTHGPALVILSGGIDSATVLAIAKKNHSEVHSVTFHYGQRHVKELGAAMSLALHYQTKHRQVQIPNIWSDSKSALVNDETPMPEGHYSDESMKATVVQNRNMVFIAIASAIAASKGCEFVLLGAHAGDAAVYPDCRPEFIKSIHESTRLSCGLRVEAPLLGMNKTQVVGTAVHLEVPLHLTWSCYQGQAKPCGKCGTCVARDEAFLANGVEQDGTINERSIVWDGSNVEQTEEFLSGVKAVFKNDKQITIGKMAIEPGQIIYRRRDNIFLRDEDDDNDNS